MSGRHASAPAGPSVDLSVRLGPVGLVNPIVAAAGTSGHGAELAAYFDLTTIGAIVVKSLTCRAVEGNPAPRVHPVEAGMLNSVGLQGPGVQAWIEEELPSLASTGASIVVSIWGRTVGEFAETAQLLRPVRSLLSAVEVNVSCPNVEDRSKMFAHSPSATTEALGASAACGAPCWAKLSPNVADLVEIADAARRGGASAVTLVNTVLALDIDIERRCPVLGSGRGGLSGPAIRTVALRAVYDCYEAMPDLPIIGVGGVSTARDAVAMLMAGASAVGVGTASLFDPRSCARISRGLAEWCERHGVARVADLVGAAHE